MCLYNEYKNTSHLITNMLWFIIFGYFMITWCICTICFCMTEQQAHKIPYSAPFIVLFGMIGMCISIIICPLYPCIIYYLNTKRNDPDIILEV